MIKPKGDNLNILKEKSKEHEHYFWAKMPPTLRGAIHFFGVIQAPILSKWAHLSIGTDVSLIIGWKRGFYKPSARAHDGTFSIVRTGAEFIPLRTESAHIALRSS